VHEVLNYLLSGGPIRRRVGDIAHGVLWAKRLFSGQTDMPELRLLDEIDVCNRIAVDVGANAGIWSYDLSRRVGPCGLVIAYEAFPHHARALSTAIRLLRVTNVRIRNLAVGDSEAVICLRWRTDDGEGLGGLTHIDPSPSESASVVRVQMVSLDYDLKRLGVEPTAVAFVKIDVEGAELAVLRGAKNLLSIGHPAVYLEAEPKWLSRWGQSIADLFAEMSALGYEAKLATEDGLLDTDAAAYSEQYESERKFNNVLFLHPDS